MLLLDQRSREMEKVKLNTTRTIWSDWSKPFICYDISVKRQNIITGILIVVATNVSIILFFSLLVCYLKVMFQDFLSLTVIGPLKSTQSNLQKARKDFHQHKEDADSMNYVVF